MAKVADPAALHRVLMRDIPPEALHLPVTALSKPTLAKFTREARGLIDAVEETGTPIPPGDKAAYGRAVEMVENLEMMQRQHDLGFAFLWPLILIGSLIAGGWVLYKVATPAITQAGVELREQVTQTRKAVSAVTWGAAAFVLWKLFTSGHRRTATAA